MYGLPNAISCPSLIQQQVNEAEGALQPSSYEGQVNQVQNKSFAPREIKYSSDTLYAVQ